MSYETILVTASDGATCITFNRPDRRNPLSPQMIDEVLEALTAAASDHNGCLILTGAGKAFCAGLDLEHLKSLAKKSLDEHRSESARVARLMRTLYEFPKPTIAAVNGPAVAGGAGLATICDFTFASTEAKFAYTEVKIGFLPAVVSTFLIAQIGDKRARDLLLTARLIDAKEAARLGLVNDVVEPEDLMPRVREIAALLNSNSLASLKATKKLLLSFARARLDADLTAAQEENALMRTDPDFFEGISSFLERRSAVWPSRAPRTHPDK